MFLFGLGLSDLFGEYQMLMLSPSPMPCLISATLQGSHQRIMILLLTLSF